MPTSFEKRCVSHGLTMDIFACPWLFQAIDANEEQTKWRCIGNQCRIHGGYLGPWLMMMSIHDFQGDKHREQFNDCND